MHRYAVSQLHAADDAFSAQYSRGTSQYLSHMLDIAQVSGFVVSDKVFVDERN